MPAERPLLLTPYSPIESEGPSIGDRTRVRLKRLFHLTVVSGVGQRLRLITYWAAARCLKLVRIRAQRAKSEKNVSYRTRWLHPAEVRVIGDGAEERSVTVALTTGTASTQLPPGWQLRLKQRGQAGSARHEDRRGARDTRAGGTRINVSGRHRLRNHRS